MSLVYLVYAFVAIAAVALLFRRRHEKTQLGDVTRLWDVWDLRIVRPYDWEKDGL